MADNTLKEQIFQILKPEFPAETVDVSDGYGDNIHVVVVSRKFDEFETERTKQEFVWDLLEKGGLSEDGLNCISLILPLSPRQLK